MDKADDFKEIISYLNHSKVVLYPTDTVWGIGCDIYDQKAVNRVYSIKKRDKSKPFIILVSDIDMLKNYVPHIHPRIETLLHYHMKPLTIIYEEPINLPEWIVTPDSTIAIRMVKDSYAKDLLLKYKKPILSTSANIQGEPTPDDFESISNKIITKMDFIVPKHKENKVQRSASVIIKYDKDGQIDLVR